MELVGCCLFTVLTAISIVMNESVVDARRISTWGRLTDSGEGMRFAECAVGALFLSGFVHLGLVFLLHADWEGAISPRKPGLFGISSGMTAWSLIWCARSLGHPRRLFTIAVALTWALLAEVTLITMQYWRGVPSHFNRTTPFDAAVESGMVGLIVLVTIGIAWMCWLSSKRSEIDAGQLLAIRGGLWLLLGGCLLGFCAMFAGEWNIAQNKPPEVWGKSGILKYPHGAALHALQTLPILNVLLLPLAAGRRVLALRHAIAAHVFFLIHSIWQTAIGRARLDLDLIGGLILVLSAASLIRPLAEIAYAMSLRFPRRTSTG